MVFICILDDCFKVLSFHISECDQPCEEGTGFLKKRPKFCLTENTVRKALE